MYLVHASNTVVRNALEYSSCLLPGLLDTLLTVLLNPIGIWLWRQNLKLDSKAKLLTMCIRGLFTVLA